MFKRSRELSFSSLGQRAPRRRVLSWALAVVVGAVLGAAGVLWLQNTVRPQAASASVGDADSQRTVTVELPQRDKASASPSR